MKKLAISLATSMFIFVQAHAGDLAVGVTANFAFTDTSGTETLRDSGKKTNATHEEDVVIPEIFKVLDRFIDPVPSRATSAS